MGCSSAVGVEYCSLGAQSRDDYVLVAFRVVPRDVFNEGKHMWTGLGSDQTSRAKLRGTRSAVQYNTMNNLRIEQ